MHVRSFRIQSESATYTGLPMLGQPACKVNFLWTKPWILQLGRTVVPLHNLTKVRWTRHDILYILLHVIYVDFIKLDNHNFLSWVSSLLNFFNCRCCLKCLMPLSSLVPVATSSRSRHLQFRRHFVLSNVIGG